MRRLPVTGLVLAGGQSRRMGQDKTQLLWQGKTWVDLAAEKLGSFCNEVLILSGSNPIQSQYPILPDSPKAQGPLAALLSGIHASHHSEIIVLAADFPLIPAGLFPHLYSQWSADAEVLIPEVAGQRQYLCSLWRKSALGTLEKAAESGTFALKAIIPELSAQIVDPALIFEGLPPEAFWNINTPEDWENLMKLENHGR